MKKVRVLHKEELPAILTTNQLLILIHGVAHRMKFPAPQGKIIWMEFDDTTPMQVFEKGWKLRPLSRDQAIGVAKLASNLVGITEILIAADAHKNRSASVGLAFAELYEDHETVKQCHYAMETFLNPHVVNMMRDALGIGFGSEHAQRTEEMYSKLFANRINPWNGIL